MLGYAAPRMPTSLCVWPVVFFSAISIRAIEMPFQQADEQRRKNGSTHSSLDEAPSPLGPTMRSLGMVKSTSIGPDWLPLRQRPSQLDGSAFTSLPMMRKQERSE